MSHRPKPQRDTSTTSNTTVPRRIPPPKPSIETSRLPSQSRRLGLPASPQANLPSSSIPVRQRPSALPRSATGTSPAIPSGKTTFPQLSSGPSRPPLTQTKSAPEDVPLVFDNVPRPHPSTLDPAHDTVLGVAMPAKTKPISPNLPPRLIPELQALAHHSPRSNPPLPPSSGSTISSPSTRFTESPAPWSAGTATTTPVSWSSVSPALTSSYGMRTPEKKSRTVPVPNPPRSRLPKLPTPQPPTPQKTPAPEPEPRPVDSRGRPVRKKSILNSPPPTPPPRTSSVKRPGTSGRSGNNSIDDTLSKGIQSGASTRPSTAPSSVDRTAAPSGSRLLPEDRIDFSAFQTHEHLQQSIKSAPTRPSRSGTVDLGESRPTVVNTHRAAFRPQHRQLLDSGFEEVDAKHVPTAPSSSERTASESKPQRSPSRLGKFSKLRVFGQRNASSTDVDKSPRKLQRRGPAAGTGHEGYGKYAAKRGRKQSTETTGTRSESDRSQSSTRRIPLFSHSRKTSTASRRTSQSDLDEFAVPRLRPVVMRGGSQTSVATDNPSSERGYFTSPDLRDTTPSPALEEHMPAYGGRLRSPLGNSSLHTRTPSNDEHIPPLALRRSQRFAPGSEAMRLPAPIRTDDIYVAPVIDSYDTTVSSNMPSSAALSLPATEARVDPIVSHEKKSRRKWWNPFRSRPQGIIVNEPVSIASPEPEMAVSYATGPAPRSIPYYAMIESESEGPEPHSQNLGVYMSEAAAESQSPTYEQYDDVSEPPRKHESVLLPPPVWSSEDLAIPVASGTPVSQPSPSRQPRLAQVGRIPKVVSRSERQHKPSRQSFSQPFARNHPLGQTPYEGHSRQFSQDEPPLLQIHTDVLPSRPFKEAENLSAKPLSAPARSGPPEVGTHEPFTTELVHTSSMHSSDVSTSSSSAGLISIMGPAIVPTSYEMEAQRYAPVVRQPSIYAGDEDVWNEFDDMIDHVMSPSRSPGSKSPILIEPPRRPLATATSGSPLIGYSNPRPASRGKMSVPEPRRGKVDLPLGTRATPPVIFPAPQLLSDQSIGEEIRLRRSRIVSALHSSYDPSSPFSMREFLKDYSEPRDSLGVSERLSSSTAQRSTLTAVPLTEAPEEEQSHQDKAMLLEVAERARDPIKTSELHYASLEVSRWLSFGRVLFSPAQNEINTLPERNVLVIDGLGNEDWSIYCAVTYETARAIVYDLKETSHHKKPSSPQLDHLPRNHRRAEIQNLGDRFPFPNAFFSVIVLRFPPAMSEAKMKNIITECRRVLVPGGHIEVMLLDFDFVNMGVQTRRAVRELKMRMTMKNSDVNLKPTIDNFQSLLGGRGFTGLNRCVVGVPVVGKAPGSTDSSTSSRSSGGSYARRPSDPTRITRQSQRGQNFSLSDLITDPSESADAQIGRMVSKTARNWWQHCYEAAVLPNGDISGSIFSEKRVLQECKMRASSFKLLIAYAQRPVFETRRRTMSESAAAAVATAGGARRPRAP